MYKKQSVIISPQDLIRSDILTLRIKIDDYEFKLNQLKKQLKFKEKLLLGK